MSELPINWLELEIDDVATVVGGGTPKANDVTNFEEPGEGIAWLTPADLSKYSNKYISHGKRDLSQKGVETSSAKLMPKGTVVFSSRAPIGYVAVAENEIATNQGFKSFVFTEHVDPSYAYYYFRSIKHIAESRGTGTTFKELSGAATKKLPFLLAPLNEQVRIANKLDTLLAKVEAAQNRFEKTPNILKRFRQSVLSAATSGELTKEWHLEHKEGEWAVSTIGSVFRCIDGDRGPNYPKKSDYQEFGHCLFLSTKNVREFGFDFKNQVYIDKEKHELLRNGTLERGDLVITTRGTLGNVANYNEKIEFDVVRVNSGMLILRKNDIKNIGEYLKIFIASPEFQKEIEDKRTGSAQPQLPANILKLFNIRIPSVLEQTEIVRRVESLFTLADTVEKQYQSAKQRLDKLTQSILSKAFRGELVPQNSNDEPAEILLERIRSQRNIEITPKTKTIKKKGKTKMAIDNKSIVDNVMPKSRATKPKETVKSKVKSRKVTKSTSSAPTDINDSSDSKFDRYEPYAKELYGLIEDKIGKNLFSLSELLNEIPWPYEQTKKGLFYLLKGDLDNKITPFAKLEWSDEYMIKLVK